VSSASAQNGKALFKQNCAACHNPLKDGTGPALKGKKEKWEKAGDDIFKWVTSSQSQIDAGIPSALSATEYDGALASSMPGQSVSKEDLASILTYIEEYEPPKPKIQVLTDLSSGSNSNDSNNSWLMWLIVGGILSIVLVLVWGVRKQLNYANRVIAGEQNIVEETAGEEIKGFLWRNLKLVSVIGFILVCTLTYYGMEVLYKVGVPGEGYNPDQPIAFTHKVHAGDNNIDCQYCHNSASKSKHAGIPTVNVCMNCHKAITEASSGDKGTAEIAKIHAAAGYDVDKRQYTGNTSPVKWVKVHNLPDHVYFSHAQHVNIGKIECENCHGDVKTYTTGEISGVETINNLELEGKKLIKLERPLLTMGWCIECHDKADVTTKGNKYYDDIHERLKKDKELYKSVMEDGKIKVRELGGWECSKCHY
jgi:cytochrome c553